MSHSAHKTKSARRRQAVDGVLNNPAVVNAAAMTYLPFMVALWLPDGRGDAPMHSEVGRALTLYMLNGGTDPVSWVAELLDQPRDEACRELGEMLCNVVDVALKAQGGGK